MAQGRGFQTADTSDADSAEGVGGRDTDVGRARGRGGSANARPRTGKDSASGERLAGQPKRTLQAAVLEDAIQNAMSRILSPLLDRMDALESRSLQAASPPPARRGAGAFDIGTSSETAVP